MFTDPLTLVTGVAITRRCLVRVPHSQACYLGHRGRYNTSLPGASSPLPGVLPWSLGSL